MSEENYGRLSDQITELRKDMDCKFAEMRKEMVTKGMLITAVILPLVGINVVFVIACLAIVANAWK